VSMEDLLHEALNLVVRARQLDDAIRAKEIELRGSFDPRLTHSVTPHLWILDQYDKDLAEWETKARNALQGKGRKL